jgi:hypothetical protein
VILKLVPLVTCIALFASTAFAADDYQLGPDSQVQDGVPKGKVVQGKLNSDKIYPFS